MWNKRNAKRYIAALLTGLLLLSGCGDSSPQTESSVESTESQPEDFTYVLSEQTLPDPEATFQPTEDNLVLHEEDSRFLESTLCYLYTIYRMDGEYNITQGSYLCLLDAPYTGYKTYSLPLDAWDSGVYYFAGKIACIGEEGILLTLASGEDSVLDYHYLGLCRWDGSCELLGSFDNSDYSTTFYLSEDTLYILSGRQLTSYDRDMNLLQSQNLGNRINGCINAPEGGTLWYGFNSDLKLAVWDKPNGKELFSLGDMVNPYSDFYLARSTDGEFLLADVTTVWSGDGSAPLEKAFSFTEKDYGLQELLGMTFSEAGDPLFLVDFKDELYLLTASRRLLSELPTKEEISLVAPLAAPLEKVAADFNRQSELYHVTVTDIWNVSDPEDYKASLQMELSAGRGPDLLGDFVVDTTGCIENGVFSTLDDVITDPENFWAAALESGKTDGQLYGIPYGCIMNVPITSRKLVGDLDSWTLEQMIALVRASNAEAFQRETDGIDLVLTYGFCMDNLDFIDYENGISHLNEQPFIDFLEFAKDYSDDLYYTADSSNAATYYQDGQLAVCCQSISSPSDLLFSHECFEGEEVLIGYPSSQGRVVYMSTSNLYLNNASQCKEGAKEFLRYLVSEEGQLCYSKNYGNYGNLPCRRDAAEKIFEIYQAEAAHSHRFITSVGVTYDVLPLDEEQTEAFWALFEDARPALHASSTPFSIIQDELTAYFEGRYSAAEAAEKLDSRVQLYLDEQK